jgi:hypothetical protein
VGTSPQDTSVLSRKYVGIREPMHPILRRCSSVEYRPADMRPPRALHDGRLRPLGASTYFPDRTLTCTSHRLSSRSGGEGCGLRSRGLSPSRKPARRAARLATEATGAVSTEIR